MATKTSKDYIAPTKYKFCDPDDIESGCGCTALKPGFVCTPGDACKTARGTCYVVASAPGLPQLIMPKHAADNEGNQQSEEKLPPGWDAFCACLKYTGKEPTAKEKADWPAATKWVLPDDYKLPKEPKVCGMPILNKTNDWECPEKHCYIVGVSKTDKTKLEVLAKPGENVRPKTASGYAAIFCIDLEKS